MSQINELIEKLCPNGVEWKTLGEVLKYEQPTKYIVESNDYSNEGTPVLTAGATFLLGYTEEINGIYTASKDNPVIIFDDFTTSFHWVDFDFKVKSSAMKMLKPINKKVNFRYVYYSMCEIKYIPVEHSRQWIGTYSQFPIPLPPLAIQSRIVEILDHFTNLTANLTAELALRRKQFEHFREKLLSLDGVEKGEMKKLGDVYEFKYGEGNTIPTIGGNYPVYGSNGIVGFHNKYNSEDAPVIGHIGAYAGIVNWAKGKHFVTYNGVICRVKDEGIINRRFGYYFLTLQDFMSMANAGSQPFISYNLLNKVQIPVPPLAVQQSIVAKLDKFTALIQNIENELALRQKQYEYYREKLLSFPSPSL